MHHITRAFQRNYVYGIILETGEAQAGVATLSSTRRSEAEQTSDVSKGLIDQPTLPQELVDAIILENHGDRATLLAWSLVSRSCNMTVIPHIFHSMCIVINPEHPTPDDFVAFLDDNPRIASLVVQLRIVNRTMPMEPYWTLDASSISGVLNSLPNLQELDMRSVHLSDVNAFWPPTMARYTLRKMYIDVSRPSVFELTTWLQVLSLFSYIGHLHLGHTPMDEHERVQVPYHGLLRISKITFDRQFAYRHIAYLCTRALRLERSALPSIDTIVAGHSYHEGKNMEKICRHLGGSLRDLAIEIMCAIPVPDAFHLQKLSALESITFNFAPYLQYGQWPFVSKFMDNLSGQSLRTINLHPRFLPWDAGDREAYRPLDEICEKFPMLESVKVRLNLHRDYAEPLPEDLIHSSGLAYTQRDVEGMRKFLSGLDVRGLLIFE